MRSLRPGAQRASIHTRLTALLAASLFASLFAFGASAAAPASVSAATPRYHNTEMYYLGLINCTRTGGWVQKDGTCIGYGTGKYSKYVAPLRLSPGLSRVALGWAKRLTTTGACKHGDPGVRLHAAGYRNWTWGENIGCYDINSRPAVLASHLAFQREKSANGGHWRNIKNSTFRYIGIGVWRARGHTRLVTDFYTP